MDVNHSIDHNLVLRNIDRWSHAMSTVTVSPKFQVVIPKDIRQAVGIEAGQKVHMMIYKGHILLVPIRPMDELRGLAKGIDASFEREPDRL